MPFTNNITDPLPPDFFLYTNAIEGQMANLAIGI
jgi:hypothetical protein